MYSLRLLGGVLLEGPSGPLSGRAVQRRQLALLALLACARDKGLTRDKLIGYLWPETDGERARHHLSDALYVLRRALGEEAVQSVGEVVRLDPESVRCDVCAFEDALEAEDVEAAVTLYDGPLVDGFYLGDGREFEGWVEAERARLGDMYASAVETLAERAEEAGELRAAAEWWKRLAAHDPYNSRAMVRLVEALAAAGDPANALELARAHEMRLRNELGIEPPTDLASALERVRHEPQMERTGPVRRVAAPRCATGSEITGARSLAQEVHRRSLWQVALVYVGGVWICSEIIATVSDRLALPTWFPTLALVLLLLGLPIVLATAFVQRGGPLGARSDRPPVSDQGEALISHMAQWLTWRKAIAGGVSVFALLGFATTGYLAMRALGVGPLGTLITRGILEERDVIVLADFVDHAGDSTLALTVTEALRVDLGQSPVVRVAERDYLAPVLNRMEQDPDAPLTYDQAREVAIREGVKALVAGEINRVGSGYLLSARLVAAESGEEIYSLRETATELDAILPAIERLSRRLREKIGESLRTIRRSPPLSRARTSSLQALRLLTEAKQANGRGQFGRAIDLLDRAIEIDTLFAEAYRQRASVLGNMGINQAQQVADAARAFELRRRLPLWERYLLEAQYYDELGDQEMAIGAYRTLLKLKDLPGALQNLGVIYEGLRQYAQAEELYRRRLEMDSLSGLSWTTLSRVQFNLGKFEQANETLRKFESKLPEHSAIPLARARFASARGDYQAAESYLTSFKDRQNPSLLRQAYFNQFMGRLAQVQGKLSEAEEFFLGAMPAFEDGGLASKYLETGIELASLRVWFLRDTARALQIMAAAEEIHPLDSIEPFERPYLALARFYALAGESDRARRFLTEWETTTPPDLRRPHAVLYRAALAAVALAEGRADDAVRESRFAYERDGCPVCQLPLLGNAYELAGLADSAVAVYERYLTTPFFGRAIAGLEPEYYSDPQWLPVVYERLGDLYEQRGDTARAIRYFGRLVNLWKDADPELEPRVEAARRAIEGLSPDI